MKRAAAVLIVAMLSFSRAGAGGDDVFSPDKGTILPASESKAVAHQCSRRSPGPIEGTWQPTAAQIKDLEARLPDVLHRNLKNYQSSTHIGSRYHYSPPSRYYRQYIGFRIGGRKLIYVNALMISDEELPYLNDWRTKAEIVCDGGAMAFGVEYDPATKTFQNFAFNGAL